MSDSEDTPDPSDHSVTLDHSPITDPEDDVISRGPVASLLADIVDDVTLDDDGKPDEDGGAVIGLIGPWGSGKTSLRCLFEKENSERETPENILVSVNAWTLPEDNIPHHFVLAVSENWPTENKQILNADNEKDVDLDAETNRRAIFDSVSVDTPGDELGHLTADVNDQVEETKEEVSSQALWQVLKLAVGLISVALLGAGIARYFKPDATWWELVNYAFFSVAAVGAPLGSYLIGNTLKKAIGEVLSVARPVSVSMPSSLVRSPGISAERLEKIAKRVADEDKRLVIWLEDVDRCTPEVATELLSLLRSVFDANGVAFIVECNAEVLAEKANVSGEDLIRKAFEHTVRLRHPPSWVQYDTILDAVGEQFGDDMKEALETTLPFVGENPRQFKRVAERTVQMRALGSKFRKRADEDDNTELEPGIIAYLESCRERWPKLWRWLERYPDRRFERLLDGEEQQRWERELEKEEEVDEAELLEFQRFCDAGRMKEPRSWKPYFRLQHSSPAFHGSMEPRELEIEVLRGNYDKVRELATNAIDQDEVDEFVATWESLFKVNELGPAKAAEVVNAGGELADCDEISTRRKFLETQVTLLSRNEKRQILPSVDYERLFALLGVVKEERDYQNVDTILDRAFEMMDDFFGGFGERREMVDRAFEHSLVDEKIGGHVSRLMKPEGNVLREFGKFFENRSSTRDVDAYLREPLISSVIEGIEGASWKGDEGDRFSYKDKVWKPFGKLLREAKSETRTEVIRKLIGKLSDKASDDRIERKNVDSKPHFEALSVLPEECYGSEQAEITISFYLDYDVTERWDRIMSLVEYLEGEAAKDVTERILEETNLEYLIKTISSSAARAPSASRRGRFRKTSASPLKCDEFRKVILKRIVEGETHSDARMAFDAGFVAHALNCATNEEVKFFEELLGNEDWASVFATTAKKLSVKHVVPGIRGAIAEIACQEATENPDNLWKGETDRYLIVALWAADEELIEKVVESFAEQIRRLDNGSGQRLSRLRELWKDGLQNANASKAAEPARVMVDVLCEVVTSQLEQKQANSWEPEVVFEALEWAVDISASFGYGQEGEVAGDLWRVFSDLVASYGPGDEVVWEGLATMGKIEVFTLPGGEGKAYDRISEVVERVEAKSEQKEYLEAAEAVSEQVRDYERPSGSLD